MSYPSRRLALVRDAIEIVLRCLYALASSREVDELRANAETALREANTWTKAPPTDEERERLMKQVLKLHTEVAKLERKTVIDAKVRDSARG